jgi:hypothetical protein
VRNPVEWSLLREKFLREDVRGEAKALLARIAREAGLKLWISERRSLQQNVELSRHIWIGAGHSRETLLDGLQHVLDHVSLTYILEGDQIRIVTLDEAFTFWNEWWKVQKEKAKGSHPGPR